jgi:hypothetical protein
MKTFALCAICGGLAFVAVQYQMTGTLLGFHVGAEAALPPPPPPPKLTFPDALAIVCRGAAVPQAAAFKKGAETHPTLILKPSGKLHPWQERLHADWKAESVEETELILIVPAQQRTLLQLVTYPNGAPSIRRYQYDLDVRALEARTGKPRGHKHFQTSARAVRPQESWALTELGDPVTFRDVYHWLQALPAISKER